MINSVKYYLLILGTIFLFVQGCKSTEPRIQESPPVESNETVSTALNDEKEKPDKEITVTVNGMVKYTFSKIDTSWQGRVTQFDSSDPQTKKIVRVLTITPKLGWNDFEEMVKFLQIYELPDQSTIENRKVGQISTISRAYEIYVFDGKEQKTYSYYNPEGEMNEHWQSRNVVTFGTFLISEMDVVQ